MNKPIKTIAVALAAIAAISVQQTEACTRATYIGPDNTVITGRTMDWKEDLMSNIYVHKMKVLCHAFLSWHINNLPWHFTLRSACKIQSFKLFSCIFCPQVRICI